jgi:hypothetical protein
MLRLIFRIAQAKEPEHGRLTPPAARAQGNFAAVYVTNSA